MDGRFVTAAPEARGIINLKCAQNFGHYPWLPFNLTAVTETQVHQVAVGNMQLYRAMLEKVMPYFTGKTDEVPLEAVSMVMPELTALAAKQSWLSNGA